MVTKRSNFYNRERTQSLLPTHVPGYLSLIPYALRDLRDLVPTLSLALSTYYLAVRTQEPLCPVVPNLPPISGD